MAEPLRRCWDSVCCLGWLKNEPDKVPACQAVLDLVDAGKVEIVVSTLALAEVLWLRGHDRIPRDSKDKVRNFFRRSSFLIASVDLPTAELAQELVWDHGVKPKDAVHVATALMLRCVSLDTFDEELWEPDGSWGMFRSCGLAFQTVGHKRSCLSLRPKATPLPFPIGRVLLAWQSPPGAARTTLLHVPSRP
jgi:predicted nucleic acid-binding protein